MKPDTTPQIPLSELISKYPALQAERHKGRVVLVMIPGYYLDTMGERGKNDRGIYDDAMIVVGPNVYATFNANTDPSAYRPKTAIKQGMATLKAGEHEYRIGNHGLSKPGGGYPAFRPATKGEKLPVWRDGDPDENAYGVALNIHRGGYHGTSSEGCQTIYPDQWITFYTLAVGEMKRLGQKTITLIKTSDA